MSAAYVSLVSRAVPCLTNEDFIRYYLPQERGWAYIHQFLIESGSDMRWPQTSANADGRWWNRVLKSFGL
jgi:hypothetical protein